MLADAVQDLHFTVESGPLLYASGHDMVSGEEGESHELETVFANRDLWFPGMTEVSQNISEVIVERLKSIPNVKAIRMGRSDDVFHVWTMIRNWTAADRKEVYAAQKELLAKLNGFNLDFYVVKHDADTPADELVSDIPVVFPAT